MKWISRLYIVFVGIILSITTGYGLAVFYPEPKAPIYPSHKPALPIPQSCYATPESQNSSECKPYFEQDRATQEEQLRLQEEQQKKQEEYQNLNAAYTRTAIFFGISVGALFAVLGMIVLKKSRLVANGLMLAGVLTAVLTRVLVGFASLGAKVAGTATVDTFGYLQFGILVVLSLVVICVGMMTLKEE